VIFGTAAFAASIICLTPSAMFYLPFGLFVALLDGPDDIGFLA
jgi:hypothetical protein